MRRMVTNAEIEKLGGTKLYKHTVTIKIELDEEEYTRTITLINTIGTSLVGQDMPEDTLSGMMEHDYAYNPVIYTSASEIIWYYTEGHEWMETYLIGKILTDTVVAL